jgi:Protein of unknown function (DUF732)
MRRSLIALPALILIAGCAASARPGSGATPYQTPDGTPSTVTEPQFTQGEQDFYDQYLAGLQQKGYTSTATEQTIVNMGTTMCTLLDQGASRSAVARGISAQAGNLKPLTPRAVVDLAGANICPQARPATVTYIVTGTSGADVTYGPAGSDYTGSVPMRVTRTLSDPSYYAISAQLQGGGQVSCEILVKGKVIASGSASGGYNIAQCEISQNPVTGQWESDDGG